MFASLNKPTKKKMDGDPDLCAQATVVDRQARQRESERVSVEVICAHKPFHFSGNQQEFKPSGAFLCFLISDL